MAQDHQNSKTHVAHTNITRSFPRLELAVLGSCVVISPGSLADAVGDKPLVNRPDSLRVLLSEWTVSCKTAWVAGAAGTNKAYRPLLPGPGGSDALALETPGPHFAHFPLDL